VPLSSQIIKPEEKAVLGRLVDLVSTLGLRFVHDKAEDGSLAYRLDPYAPSMSLREYLNSRCDPVDVSVTCDGRPPSDITISRNAIRQLVANEVRLNSQLSETLPKKGGNKTDAVCYRELIGEDEHQLADQMLVYLVAPPHTPLPCLQESTGLRIASLVPRTDSLYHSFRALVFRLWEIHNLSPWEGSRS